jgi:hypothetical protein
MGSGERKKQEFPNLLLVSPDCQGVLASITNEICPPTRCVNIHARKLYTLHQGMEGVASLPDGGLG